MNKEQFIFGWHPVMEALDSGKELQRVFLLKNQRNERSEHIRRFCAERNVPVQYVPIQRLDRITRKNHQGVIAYVSPIQFADLTNLVAMQFETGRTPALLALDGITDVRNFGAICRSAESFGFDALVIPSSGMAPINEEAIKSSSGALMRIPICRSDKLINDLSELKLSGFQIFGLSEKGQSNLLERDFSAPLCMVMGNEETGLSSAVQAACDDLLCIRTRGKTGSLNVSVSAAIAMFSVSEWRSQHPND